MHTPCKQQKVAKRDQQWNFVPPWIAKSQFLREEVKK